MTGLLPGKRDHRRAPAERCLDQPAGASTQPPRPSMVMHGRATGDRCTLSQRSEDSGVEYLDRRSRRPDRSARAGRSAGYPCPTETASGWNCQRHAPNRRAHRQGVGSRRAAVQKQTGYFRTFCFSGQHRSTYRGGPYRARGARSSSYSARRSPKPQNCSADILAGRFRNADETHPNITRQITHSSPPPAPAITRTLPPTK